MSTLIWYRAGSRFEKPGITGISHFLEHMLFKSTKRFPKGEIDRLTAINGGFNNAFTALDYTTFCFSFAADRWSASLEIEADRMSNALFSEEEFETEKGVILEEIRMERDDPWEVMRQAVTERAFSEHPYRYPVIGLREDIRSVTLDQMKEYYQSYYVPNNAVLSVAGAFDSADVVRQVEALFGSIPSRKLPPLPVTGEENWTGPVRLELNHPSAVTRMMVALPSPSIRQVELSELDLLDKVLIEGKLSRLYRRLVEQEKCVSFLTTEFTESIDPFLSFIRLDLTEGVDPDFVEKLVFEELERLGCEEVTPEELRRAKNQCASHFLNDSETTFDQALQLGLLETLDSWERLVDYLAQLEATTATRLCQVAAQYLSPQRALVATVTDEEKGRGGVVENAI